MHACCSVAQTFWTRPPFLQNCALARSIQKNSDFGVDWSVQEIGDFAFKAVWVGGSAAELVVPLLEQNCTPVQDMVKCRLFFFFFLRRDALDIDIFKNRAPVRSILEISSICLHQIS